MQSKFRKPMKTQTKHLPKKSGKLSAFEAAMIKIAQTPKKDVEKAIAQDKKKKN